MVFHANSHSHFVFETGNRGDFSIFSTFSATYCARIVCRRHRQKWQFISKFLETKNTSEIFAIHSNGFHDDVKASTRLVHTNVENEFVQHRKIKLKAIPQEREKGRDAMKIKKNGIMKRKTYNARSNHY